MGNFITKLNNILQSFSKSREARITMVGLDAAGKTTILHKLKLGETVQTIPTIGFNVETLQFKNIKFNVWDIGGQKKLRDMWQYYYENVDAIIYVIDSSDENRLKLNKETFNRILSNDNLENVPVLLLANKQDISRVSLKEVIQGMELDTIKGRAWHLQGTSGISGEGLVEGLGWLHGKLNN